MLNIFAKNYLKLACFILAAPTLCLKLYAVDDSSKPEPAIKTAFTPNFDQGFITVSITNITSNPIKVWPALENSFPLRHEIEPECIYVCIMFTIKPNTHLVYTQEEQDSFSGMITGYLPPPIEIAPGETKPIKFLLPKYLIKMAKSAGEVKIIFDYNHAAIQNIIFNKINNLWKNKE